ncbi:hypothetical protein CY34DRAFT_809692 [Suillus luteus UH-Slu-Lm8-n1]|uniref:Uncharacterized protein n=1 Tax=Suillus luteus UH-Slu-Lm8-n1 TaxID=930992 RepID=A0A0D0B2H8_9AGAM|nr:hypothetical protein CY34DRAFT_809692 [Suillus luteus UH-Slu-Lm8-n1]
MDEDGRSFTNGEVKFFSQCGTGSIIVLFTKFDALCDDEFAELLSNGVSRKDTEALVPQRAKEAFANGPQLKLCTTATTDVLQDDIYACLIWTRTMQTAGHLFNAQLKSWMMIRSNRCLSQLSGPM